ncbi:hypothetical protein [Actinacidiphila acididurans]|nr:hypothetical protein [Actinacidiphila acididurans]
MPALPFAVFKTIDEPEPAEEPAELGAAEAVVAEAVVESAADG